MAATEEAVEVLEEAPVAIVPALDGSGEVVDLAAATDEELAAYVEDATEQAAQTKAHVEAVKRQLRDRMDSDLTWTRRIGDPASGFQWEAKCPSPDAATTVYHDDELIPVLRQLVKDQVCGVAAANGAVTRSLTVVFDVPLAQDLDELASEVASGNLPLSVGPGVHVRTASGSSGPHMPGVKKLAKLPAAAAALAEIAHENKPQRRVSIKRIEKNASR